MVLPLRKTIRFGYAIQTIHLRYAPGDRPLGTEKSKGCWTSWRTAMPPFFAGLYLAPSSARRTASLKSGCVEDTIPNDSYSTFPDVSTTNSARTDPVTPVANSAGGYLTSIG